MRNEKTSDDKSNSSSQKSNEEDCGLASFSYAEFVILSSTLAYALAEELQDADLDMFIVFLGMISSDLALIRTKRGIERARALQQDQEDGDSTAIDDTIVDDITFEAVDVSLLRKKKYKRRKVKRTKGKPK